MPFPPEVLARVTALASEVQSACARANVTFVLVLEPRDVRTGVLIVTEDVEPTERTVRETRGLLEAAAERLRHTHYAVVTAPEPR